MISLLSTHREVAEQYVGATLRLLQDERGVHVETAVAAIARMAGSFLLQSFALPLVDLKPGTAILSEEANTFGPQLIEVLRMSSNELAIPIDGSRVTGKTPQEHLPHLSFVETHERLREVFEEIRNTFQLSLRDAADAVAVATAMLIQRAAAALDPTLAVGIAIYGFVEGSKTVPTKARLSSNGE